MRVPAAAAACCCWPPRRRHCTAASAAPATVFGPCCRSTAAAPARGVRRPLDPTLPWSGCSPLPPCYCRLPMHTRHICSPPPLCFFLFLQPRAPAADWGGTGQPHLAELSTSPTLVKPLPPPSLHSRHHQLGAQGRAALTPPPCLPPRPSPLPAQPPSSTGSSRMGWAAWAA